MKFSDIELEYEDKTYTVKANKVFKLYRDVSPMVLFEEHLAKVETLIADKPFIFSDAYTKALSHAGLDVDSGEVCAWMCSGNYEAVLNVIGKIKTLFQQPEKIQKKTGSSAKKKKATKKK